MHIQGLLDRQGKPHQDHPPGRSPGPAHEHCHAAQFKQRRRAGSRADLRHRAAHPDRAAASTRSSATRRRRAFQDWQGARQAAAETKWEAVNHLDQYLDQFVAQARSARHEGALGQHRAAGARDHPRHHAREEGALDRQVQGDDLRGNPPQRGAGARRLRGGRVRPGRVHRPTAQGTALPHRLPGDAPDARRNQRAVPAEARQRPVRQPGRADHDRPAGAAAEIHRRPTSASPARISPSPRPG